MMSLHTKIMWRVYLIYIARMLFRPLAVKAYIFTALLWQSTTHVSVLNVWENAPHSASLIDLASFVGSAFVHTETVTKLLVVAGTIFVVWAIFDVIQKTPFRRTQTS